jgi:hypothetical protein
MLALNTILIVRRMNFSSTWYWHHCLASHTFTANPWADDKPETPLQLTRLCLLHIPYAALFIVLVTMATQWIHSRHNVSRGILHVCGVISCPEKGEDSLDWSCTFTRTIACEQLFISKAGFEWWHICTMLFQYAVTHDLGLTIWILLWLNIHVQRR